MDYDKFLKEMEHVESLPSEEQKAFYMQILKEHQNKSKIEIMAYFQYALLFYYEGDFRKTKEILEPFIIDYQRYEYIPEMISCFNLAGVASHCEGEYALTRYFYEKALEIAEQHGEKSRFSYEYNNIALTYIAEQDFEEALRYILLAERYLPDSDDEMGAYVYLNKAAIYHNLNELDASLKAFELCDSSYHGFEVLPDDFLICGASLFYKRGENEKYAEYKNKILEKLEEMHASEFIDACMAIFDCSLDSRDYALIGEIIEAMDDYMLTHPQEIKVGLKVEACKYAYAKELNDCDAMLEALKKKNQYYGQIVKISEKNHIQEIEQYSKINRQLQKKVERFEVKFTEFL